MLTVVRTADTPAAERRERWRSIVCDTLGPLDMRIDPDVPLHGEITTGQLGDVGVANVRTSTPHGVHRTPGLIRKGDADLYRVVLPISGHPRLTQDGRETVLAPDTFGVYDFSRPYDLVYTDAVELAVIGFPRGLLPVRPGMVAGLTATAVPATGVGGLLAPMLGRIAREVGQYDPTTAARLAPILLDLLGTALAEYTGYPDPVESSQQALLFQVKAFIEQHLGNSDLTPAVIAAAHHVSLRQLHRLFAPEQTSVGAWIRQRRLDRCRKDLADPAQSGVAVGAVAARWGLSDAAHFSRLFRAAFGVPPSDYRRMSLNPVAASQLSARCSLPHRQPAGALLAPPRRTAVRWTRRHEEGARRPLPDRRPAGGSRPCGYRGQQVVGPEPAAGRRTQAVEGVRAAGSFVPVGDAPPPRAKPAGSERGDAFASPATSFRPPPQPRPAR
ncbi:helix-turn-helix domain-containing protein [Micromonospora sp. NPDC002717]|uniref:AraC-like ligand-binding domain-containing protein n=1 Tax=Micromonospora sp. NPDC002717 TaxID=3154424 RepID=UPI003322463A